MTEPWNIHTWIRTCPSRAFPGLGFVRVHLDRGTVVLTLE